MIQSLDKTVASEIVEFEADRAPAREPEALAPDVYLERCAGIVEQPTVRALVHDDSDQAVLQGVIAKNIGNFG